MTEKPPREDRDRFDVSLFWRESTLWPVTITAIGGLSALGAGAVSMALTQRNWFARAALALAAPAALVTAASAAHAGAPTGNRIDRHLDRKGDRIDDRLDRRSERQENLGHERAARRLDRRGDRIENRLDRKGDRIDRRLGGSAD